MAFTSSTFTNTLTQTKWFSGWADGAETDTELIAAPGVGKAVVIYSIHFSTDAQQKILVETGTSQITAQYAAANGGKTVHFGEPSERNYRDGLMVTTNASVTFTNTAANVIVEILYRIVDV